MNASTCFINEGQAQIRFWYFPILGHSVYKFVPVGFTKINSGRDTLEASSPRPAACHGPVGTGLQATQTAHSQQRDSSHSITVMHAKAGKMFSPGLSLETTCYQHCLARVREHRQKNKTDRTRILKWFCKCIMWEGSIFYFLFFFLLPGVLG